ERMPELQRHRDRLVRLPGRLIGQKNVVVGAGVSGNRKDREQRDGEAHDRPDSWEIEDSIPPGPRVTTPRAIIPSLPTVFLLIARRCFVPCSQFCRAPHPESHAMRTVRLIVGMVMLAGLMAPIVLGQDKTKDVTPGKRAQLPPNYSKL